MEKLHWIYDYDHTIKVSATSWQWCPEHIWVAQFDNSAKGVWVAPWTANSITIGTFCRHVRRLAQEYCAKEVLVTTLDKIPPKDKVIVFRWQSMFADDDLSADKDNWWHQFWLVDKFPSPFTNIPVYASQVFVTEKEIKIYEN